LRLSELRTHNAPVRWFDVEDSVRRKSQMIVSAVYISKPTIWTSKNTHQCTAFGHSQLTKRDRLDSAQRTRTFLRRADVPYFLEYKPCLEYKPGVVVYRVTAQLADTPTRGLPTRGLDISRTGQLAGLVADWASRGLDNSRSRRCRQKGKLSTQTRRWHPRVVQ